MRIETTQEGIVNLYFKHTRNTIKEESQYTECRVVFNQNTDDEDSYFAFAYLNPKDQFIKSMGRNISLGRLLTYLQEDEIITSQTAEEILSGYNNRGRHIEKKNTNSQSMNTTQGIATL